MEAPLAGLTPDRVERGLLIGAEAEWPDTQWWRRFGDAQLDRLMQLALADSPVLDVLDARVRAARAEVEGARANGRPNVNGFASASRARIRSSRPGDNSNGMASPDNAAAADASSAQGLALPEWSSSGIAAAQFSYDFDWWGKHRAAIEAAIDNQYASLAERSAAAWLIEYAVATIYFDWSQADLRAAIADEAVRTNEAQLRIAQLRVQRGVDSPQTLEQANRQLASTRQQREQLRGTEKVYLGQIAALLGRSLADLPALQAPHSLPSTDARVPNDARLKLLNRRPDIVASRWMVESAARNVDQARAAFFPDISINALAGLLRSQPTPGPSSNIGFGTLGISAYLPLFDGGRLQSRYAVSRAEWDGAIAQYNAAVVAAAEDVVRQTLKLQSLDAQRIEQRQQLQSAQRSFVQSRARVGSGVDDPRIALAAHIELIEQRDANAQLDGQMLATQLSLIRALGGGYVTDAAITAPPGALHPDQENSR